MVGWQVWNGSYYFLLTCSHLLTLFSRCRHSLKRHKFLTTNFWMFIRKQMTLDVYYFLLLLDIHYLEHPFTPGLTLICSPNWNFFQKAEKKNCPLLSPLGWNHTLGWKICISIYTNEWPLKGKDSPRPILRKRWRQMSHKTADCLFHSGWACKDDDI